MANGWWNDDGAIAGIVAAHAPIYAASLAASYVNLANSGTYDLTVGVAPTLAAGMGWDLNGSTMWLKSGVRLNSSGTVIVKAKQRATGDQYVCTQVVGGSEYRNYGIQSVNSGATKFYCGTTTATNVGAGILHSYIFAIAKDRCYINGDYKAAISGWVDTGTAVRDMGIGVLWPGYGPYSFFDGYISAITMFSTQLTDAEVARASLRMSMLKGTGDGYIPSAGSVPTIASSRIRARV